jgi:phosphosulfolactate phosphohydrolase-like enzyme
MARQLFLLGKNDLLKAASESRNGRRLLVNPDLRDDVALCLQRDIYNFAAALQSDGKIRIVK